MEALISFESQYTVCRILSSCIVETSDHKRTVGNDCFGALGPVVRRKVHNVLTNGSGSYAGKILKKLLVISALTVGDFKVINSRNKPKLVYRSTVLNLNSILYIIKESGCWVSVFGIKYNITPSIYIVLSLNSHTVRPIGLSESYGYKALILINLIIIRSGAFKVSVLVKPEKRLVYKAEKLRCIIADVVVRGIKVVYSATEINAYLCAVILRCSAGSKSSNRAEHYGKDQNQAE